jgi:uncharacterized membrane protein (UPF0182 family)
VAQNPPKEQESRTATPVPTSVGSTLASTRERRVPPYYTLMVQPGTNNLQFVSVRSFVPFSDNDQLKTLSAFMTVSSDAGDYGKMRVYVMSSPLPDGPSLADSTMKSNFAQNLTLLDQSGSRVTFGDQQLIPIGNQLMYVRVWYVQATGQTPVPQVNAVTLTYGQSAYRGSTLEDVLNKAFGVQLDFGTVVGGSIAPLPGTGTGSPTDPSATTTTTTPPTTEPGATTTPTTAAPTSSNPDQLLAQAQSAYDAAQAALRAGDLGTYQAKLTEAYNLAAQAASIATGTAVTAGPSTTTAPAAPEPSTTANA